MKKYQILVKGIVKNLDQFLIVERWYNDRIQDPFQWEFIDGEVLFGESPEKAVQRLVVENTSLHVQVDRPLYTWSFMKGEVFTVGISYLCLTGEEQVLLSEELNSFQWVTREELGQYIKNPSVLSDINKAELE